MVEQWIKDLILERDAVVQYRHQAQQDYQAATAPEEKQKFMDRMNDANGDLSVINAKLGI